MGIFLGVNFPGGSCLVGIIRKAIFRVGVFLVPISYMRPPPLMINFINNFLKLGLLQKGFSCLSMSIRLRM